MVSLDDEKAKHIADALGNETSKKILKFLADREASESEIASSLKMNLNTIEYNLNKLVKAGFVVKSKNFLWSEKGKKIEKYKLANKSILISPRASLAKSIVPVAVISAVFTYFIWFFTRANVQSNVPDVLTEKAASGIMAGSEAAGEIINSVSLSSLPVYVWFLFGALFALVVFLIINWRKL